MNLYNLILKLKSGLNKIFAEPVVKKSFGSCGQNVRVSPKCFFSGISNINLGNNVSLGMGTTVLSVKAKLTIGNDVMFGPNVTVITGDHRTDVIGRTMASITENEKVPENDLDITIENDVWVGANATILKGVTIGTGSIIASGAVVNKDIPPYEVWGGVPARFLGRRFNDEDLKKHLEITEKNYD